MSSLETRLAGPEAEAASLTGLEGLLEGFCGIDGSGRLFDAGTIAVVAEVVASPVSRLVLFGWLTLTSEYFNRSSPIFALRRLIGMRLIRLSIRDRRSED
jgi:hypothetical protein